MNIYIIGAGSFGTAIANQFSLNTLNDVFLISRHLEQVEEINVNHTNKKYFPNNKLRKSVQAALISKNLLDANVIFIALPSSAIEMFFEQNKHFFSPKSLIVNLSKGLMMDGRTIVEYIKESLCTNKVATMKGATFASEIMNNNHSLFTLGFNSIDHYNDIKKIVQGTHIHLDYTTDIKGVEFLSILKNIYAILIGFVDAKYNSANTRFMVLTKSFHEIKIILKILGGKDESLFLSCGFGDLTLTSLNDLSRNRTLGLLIGKGFYSDIHGASNNIVLEGVKSVELIGNAIPKALKSQLPLFDKIQNFFIKKNQNLNIDFNELFDKKIKIVLTYGTFDLLHYGHIEILRRAKEFGDRLIVGISTDEFNKVKGKECVISYQKRKELLEAIEYVDMVIPESNWEQKIEDIERNEVDLFIMGSDWNGKFDELKEYCEVIYLPRTEGISTTKLKSIINI